MGLVQFVRANLFSEKRDIRTKLINFVMLTILIGSFVVLVADVIGKFDALTNYSLLVVFVTCGLCLWLANFKNHTGLACILICIMTNGIAFPAMFFLNGGIDGGMMIWMSLGYVLCWLLLTGKTTIIFCCMFFAIDAVTIWIGSTHPNLIIPLSANQRTMDVLVSMITGGVMTSAIIWYGNHLRLQQTKEIMKKDEHIKLVLNEASIAYQDKNDFFAAVSHDLRTPLAAIVGFSEVAKACPDDNKRLNSYMEKIHASSIHLMGLVDKIVDLNQIDSGRIVIDENEANLQKVFSEMMDMVSVDASQKNISISIDTKNVFCKDVLLDVSKFDQCILAIIDNAIKYTKPNGKVDIKVSQRRNRNPKLVDTYITVTDNGIGMSKQYIEHLFEAFSKENKTSDSGTGLSLTIAKRIIDKLNGKINVDSELGVGTTITVEVPLRIQVDLRENKESILHEGFRNRHILLAEDNKFNAEMFIDILEGMGIKVELAEDGAACVDMYRDAPNGYYDIVFMDIQMPYKDGYVATKDIRSMDNVCSKVVPIVAITANAYEEDKLKAVEAGMNFYITKPVDVKELAEVMKVQFRIYDEWRTENGISFATQKTLPSGKQ